MDFFITKNFWSTQQREYFHHISYFCNDKRARAYENNKESRRIYTEELPVAIHRYVLHLSVYFHHAVRMDVY